MCMGWGGGGGGGGGEARSPSLFPPRAIRALTRSICPFPLPFEHLLRRRKRVFKEDLLLERFKGKYCWFARDVTVAMFVPGQEQSVSLLWEVNTILI